jgi:hypothetical protein
MQTDPTKPKPTPTKQFEVTLLAKPEDIQKLTGKDPMPSWVIGEKIAEAIHKGITHIKLNVHEAFLQYHV